MSRHYTRWTPERDAELHRLWVIERRSRTKVAAYLGCTPQAVHARCGRLGWERSARVGTFDLAAYQRRVFVRRKRVRCLVAEACGGWFFSPDPKRVRVCDRCRAVLARAIGV